MSPTPRPRHAFPIALAILVLASLPAGAQSEPGGPDIASLERAAADAPPAARSAALLELAGALESVDMGRALEAARRARAAATTPRDELVADARIANVQRQQGDYAAAVSAARPAYARALEVGDDLAQTHLELALARISWSLADYPAALTGYQDALRHAERLGERWLAARARLGIAITVGQMGDRLRAREEELQALKIGEELGDLELQADALNNLGNNYYSTGNLALARETHERSRAIRVKQGRRRGEADSLINLGEVARRSGELEAALDYSRRAMAVYEQLGVKRNLANANIQVATVLLDLGRTDEARGYLDRGFALAEALGSPTVLAEFHRTYALLHEKRGDWQAAAAAHRAFNAAREASVGDRARQQIAALTARHDAERRQAEIAMLREEQARKEAELEGVRWQRYGLATALVLGLATLGAIISRQRLKLRTERRVLEQARAAQQAAEEADRVKTRFLGVASHDIRGPLGNIANLARHLRPGAIAQPDPEVWQEHLDLINAEAQRVLCLVEDLITTAALETGRLELRLGPIDLGTVARAAVESIAWQAEAKRQTIVFPQPAADARETVGDAARLHQVFANLLGNAIKFSPPGSTITLTLERAGNTLVLIVRDQGAGLSAEDAARLFKPFKRLATHPTAGESSHGLGLSIAQEIVRLHGGVIRVESEPGRGSAFRVELPAK